VKIALQLKAYLLLLLLTVSILPLRIFCNDDDHHHTSLSVDAQSNHHDCPFCSIQFYNDFEKPTGFESSPNSSFYQKYLFLSLGKTIHFTVCSKNKGPPTLFI